jgi:hypothetical protein
MRLERGRQEVKVGAIGEQVTMERWIIGELAQRAVPDGVFWL